MSLSVNFNGRELSSIIHVLNGFTTKKGTDWQPQMKDYSGRIKGSSFQYTTYKNKIIEMPFSIDGNLEQNYNALEAILNVDEPKPLIFGSAPQKVYYAVPMNDLDLEEILCFGEGVITWIIPDGLAHSIIERTFNASVNQDGILELNVINNGTEAVPISYEITHKHENGFIGIVSGDGVIQLGHAQELDEEMNNKSEVLANYTSMSEFQARATLNTGEIGYPGNYPLNGTTNIVERAGYTWLAPSNLGTGSSWHGTSRTLTIPSDGSGNTAHKKFQANAKLMFESTNAGHVGWMAFSISDVEGKPLASIHIWKAKYPSSLAIIQFNVGHVKKWSKEFIADASSPFIPQKGQVYIRKDGDLFEFYCDGQRHQFNVPGYASKGAKYITVFFGQMKDWGYWWTPWMGVNMIRFQTDSAEYTGSIPNRYSDRSVVTIDGETTKVRTDGVLTQGDEITGSKYFKAKPGENIIKVVVSDFCVPLPDVKATIREAWL